ncbi:hypothetical protein [Nocardioides sp. TF02-7]|uniref:hypothetical protein n=1 Tax=Nocardioides sp. TF02-7 TaxID=2917724 RepID=UPI001F0550D1|nr:hypothetical protein [Nocardioides sp. TF02-7]UMG93308.1 hypothetical protein MF408_03235 [Nocardioides sp. TF02-7]
MRFSLSLANGATGARCDVLVDADPETEVAELLPRLLAATGGEMHPAFARQVAVWVDGRRVDVGWTLRQAGVRPGCVVALHEPDGYDAALPHGVVELRVVSGPGAGRVHRFGIGEHQVGNGAAGMSLPDLFLPRRRARHPGDDRRRGRGRRPRPRRTDRRSRPVRARPGERRGGRRRGGAAPPTRR